VVIAKVLCFEKMFHFRHPCDLWWAFWSNQGRDPFFRTYAITSYTNKIIKRKSGYTLHWCDWNCTIFANRLTPWPPSPFTIERGKWKENLRWLPFSTRGDQLFIIIIIGSMVVYYIFNRPLKILRFALLLSISTLVVAVALSLVQHVIIAHNCSLYWKHSLIMWMISFFAPFLVGLFYAKISKKN
jgi:hypothetical protein